MTAAAATAGIPIASACTDSGTLAGVDLTALAGACVFALLTWAVSRRAVQASTTPGASVWNARPLPSASADV